MFVYKKNDLHHFSFETPTLEGGLSDNGDTFSALEMRKGVNHQNNYLYHILGGSICNIKHIKYKFNMFYIKNKYAKSGTYI